MKRYLLTVACLAFCVAITAKQPEKFRDDTVLVKPKKGELAQLKKLHQRLGVRVQHTLKGIGNLQIVKLPPGLSVEKAIEHYKKSGQVEYAEPDYIVHALPVDTNELCQAVSPGTSDPYFQDGTLWGMHNYGQNGGTCGADIDAPEGWEIRTDAGNVIVGVIDTGIRYTHEDLAANVWSNVNEIAGNSIDDDNNGVVDDVYGARFINGVVSGDPWDDHFHGSHVAGTIMGAGDNGKGVIGVAWSGRVMGVKFLNAAGSGYISDAVLAVDYARQMGAKVLNNSWGGGGFSQALLDAIHATRDANMIFVAAAGNNSSDNDGYPFYPANYNSDNLVTIAATDRNDRLAGFSNWGKNSVELGAPGVEVWSCNNTSDSSYRYASGTSMATPHTAGVIALLWAQYPTASYSSIITRLLRGVDYIDSLGGRTVTGGRLNLHRSIEDPVADFDVTVTNVPAPMTATFTDRSLAWGAPIISRQFDLGDGTVTNAAVLTHTYATEGPYVATLRVDNSAGNYSTQQRLVPGHIASGQIFVDPDEAYWAEGPYGGPFEPYFKEYRIYNIGDGTLDYNTTSTVNWVYFDYPSGSLPPGFSTSVGVYMGGTSLLPGIYGGAVDFVNTGNGAGNAQRWMQLTVKAPGALVVTPTNAFESAGYQFGLFSPSNFTYTVQNVSTNFTLEFAAVPNADWQTVDVESGTLSPGQSTNVVVSINANATNLSHGVYTEAVGFNNNTTGEYLGDRFTVLTVNPLLQVTPTGNFNSSGQVGGPFSPNSITYTIEWLGTTPVNWTAYSPDDWFTVSPEFGTLNPNEPLEVTVSYNSNANNLPEGVWESGVTFTADQLETYVNRFTQLIVGQGQLFVTPYGGWNASGAQGGPFSPVSKTYRLLWVGVTNVQWTTDFSANWITASPASGTLTNGQYVDVTISINEQAKSLTPGNYQGFFEFINVETKQTYEVFAVNLTVTPAGTLSVEPITPLERTGPDGGPFATGSYMLRNYTAYPLNWTASSSAPWISLYNTNNTLPAYGIAYMTIQINTQANSFAVGSYTGTVTFVNTSNDQGNTARDVLLTVVPAGVMSVSPTDAFTSSGPQGGPFTPPSKTYTVSNTGGWPIYWSVGYGVSWFTVSPTYGQLAAGASTNVVVTITANSTPSGTYSNVVNFFNSTNGRGNTSRSVILTIGPQPGVLSVTPAGGSSSSGYAGGPFNPANFAYQLSNTGSATLNWTASKTAAWVSLSQTSGSLNPGGSTTVNVSINTSANSLTAGTYNDTVSFVNTTSGNGNTTRALTLTVNPIPPGVLSVSPAGGLTSSGYQYGPFSPSSQAYTLSNTGSLALNWTATKSAAWVSLSGTSGSLNPGANTTVTVSINTNANGLAGGSYSDTVSFNNTTTGNGNTTRPVSLSVTNVILNAPTSLVATQLTSTSVRLNWNDTSTNEQGFAIERAVKSGSNWGAYSQITTVGSNVTTYTNTGVSKKSYRYRVRSYRSTTYGPYSNVTEITVK